LTEMNRDALGYTINVSRSWLSEPGPRAKFFAFEGYGATNLRHAADVDGLMTASGFALAHKDDFVTAFVPQAAYQPDPPKARPAPAMAPAAAPPPSVSPSPAAGPRYDLKQARYLLDLRLVVHLARRSVSVLRRGGVGQLAQKVKSFFVVAPSPVLSDRPPPP